VWGAQREGTDGLSEKDGLEREDGKRTTINWKWVE